jgi:hypothetical protein
MARAAAALTLTLLTSLNHPGTLGRCAGSAIDQHDLAFHGTPHQKFHSLSRFNKRERAAKQRIKLLLARSAKIFGRSSGNGWDPSGTAS